MPVGAHDLASSRLNSSQAAASEQAHGRIFLTDCERTHAKWQQLALEFGISSCCFVPSARRQQRRPGAPWHRPYRQGVPDPSRPAPPRSGLGRPRQPARSAVEMDISCHQQSTVLDGRDETPTTAIATLAFSVRALTVAPSTLTPRVASAQAAAAASAGASTPALRPCGFVTSTLRAGEAVTSSGDCLKLQRTFDLNAMKAHRSAPSELLTLIELQSHG
jgi:hypothetical protein